MRIFLLVLLLTHWAFAETAHFWCSLGFSRDGKALMVGGENGELSLWSNGKPRLIPGHTDQVHGILALPNGDLLSYARDESILVTNPVTLRQRRWKSSDASQVSSAALSPDGQRLATWGTGPAQIWEVATGKLLSKLDASPVSVTEGAFSPDGRTFILGVDTSLVVFRDGRRVRKVALPDSPRGLASGPDGTVWALTGSQLLHLDVETGQELAKEAVALDSEACGLRLSPDGKTCLVVGYPDSRFRSLVWGSTRWELNSRLFGFVDNDTVLELPQQAGYAKLLQARDGSLIRKVVIPGSWDNVVGIPDTVALSGKTIAYITGDRKRVRTVRL